jgi:UDP-N-acetylmuramoyl-L-alanyl-D-glutamate--2,6-diaminopimelate ligase
MAPTDWLDGLKQAEVVAGMPGAVAAVYHDSRRVTPGALFVAVPGFTTDGHDHLEEALSRGASALLVQADRRDKWEPLLSRTRAAVVAVPDTRRALSAASAAFYGYPARRLGVVGVTGTDGKTTTIYLIAAVLEAAGHKTGYLSSAEIDTGDGPRINDTHMTTLEAPDIQAALARMVAAGCEFAVIETSSHGLALDRVDDCDFDIAVFTTLRSDHLDFHGTLEEYRQAKGRLFRLLDEGVRKQICKRAILNADEPASAFLRQQTTAPITTYGIESDADIRTPSIRLHPLEIEFTTVGVWGEFSVKVRLAGPHNAYNCLAAAAVGLSLGATPAVVADALGRFPGVPGHLEAIDDGQPFKAIVDIASTPEALRNVLEVLRPATEGHLWVVFGCAGERDPGRRAGIGRAAATLADRAVLTNEDPRSEDPDAIIDAIAQGMAQAGREEGRDFVRIPDRREAIAYAFAHARPGDTVLLAGKGAEQTMVFGDRHVPWDERAVARELLTELVH